MIFSQHLKKIILALGLFCVFWLVGCLAVAINNPSREVNIASQSKIEIDWSVKGGWVELGNEPYSAIDGSQQTWWYAQQIKEGKAWIELKFPHQESVDKIKIFFGGKRTAQAIGIKTDEDSWLQLENKRDPFIGLITN